jgi:hypothetical protein
VTEILRIASRALMASLTDDLTRRMDQLFSNFDDSDASETAKWFHETFRFDSPKTPKGQKPLKELASKFHYFLRDSGSQKDYQGKVIPGNSSSASQAAMIWQGELKSKAGDLVQHFSNEGTSEILKELKIGSNTYLNKADLATDTLKKYAKAMEKVFDELKGWRKKALAGGVTVMFASARDFSGTVSGKYKRADDILMVRATPAVVKRTGGTYAAFDYIMVHELGHRYEHKNQVKYDFDSGEWHTSRYSTREGESFAELFAISNFDLKGPWNQAAVEKFQKLMGD